MRFFNFHLMPYAKVDLDAIQRNGSAWVTFSNQNYDPFWELISIIAILTKWNMPTNLALTAYV